MQCRKRDNTRLFYYSGRFRMGGRGSLSGLMPYKDANAVVVEMADEVLPVSRLSYLHAVRIRRSPEHRAL